MPFNVLLLPLLGGYLFLTHWNRTRFDTNRYSGERLIFHSAAAGVIFLLLSFIFVTAIRLVSSSRLDCLSTVAAAKARR
jgi:membrane-associated protease RseP (regulator of RpoE activity)